MMNKTRSVNLNELQLTHKKRMEKHKGQRGATNDKEVNQSNNDNLHKCK